MKLTLFSYTLKLRQTILRGVIMLVKEHKFSYNWLDRLQLFHTFIFWSMLLTAMFNLSSVINIEWGVLFQFWILNLFVYLFISVANAMKLPLGFIGMYLFYMGLYVTMISYSLNRF